jgi:hypothetical protein
MTSDRLRDERDSIQAKIEALMLRRAALSDALITATTHEQIDRVTEAFDADGDRIAALEAVLDEADAAVARDDPERRLWGHDGI